MYQVLVVVRNCMKCVWKGGRRYCPKRVKLLAQGLYEPPGVTTFAKDLASNDVTYGMQERYWARLARFPHHRIVRFKALLDKKIEHNLSIKQFKALGGSYKKFRKIFPEKVTAILNESFGFNLKAQSRDFLKAQGWFPIPKIKHEISLNIPQMPQLVPDNISLSGDSIFNKIGEVIDKMTNGDFLIKWRGRLIRYLMFIFELVSSSSVGCKIRSAIQCFSDVNFSNCGIDIKGYVLSLLQVFRGATQRLSQLVAQGETVVNQENIIQGTFKLMCSLFESKGPLEVRTESSRVNRLCNLAKSIKSIDTIYVYIDSLLKYVKELYETHYLGLTPYDVKLREVGSAIPEWMKEVADIYNSEGLARVNGDRELAERVRSLKEKGDEYYMLLNKARAPTSMLAYFRYAYDQVKELYKASVPNQFSDSSRATPFAIYIMGGSGVGKSYLQKAAIMHLMKMKGIPYDPTRDLYTRNPAQAHWDGYHNQKVCLMDDFLQMEDVQLRTEMLGEIINMINHVSYPLKMAAIDQKGVTRFTSELVVFTSNMDLDHTIENLVRNPEAIRRRRHVVVEVKVNPEYSDKNGFIDTSKAGNSFNRDVYLFDVKDPVEYRGAKIHTNMRYDAFLHYCLEQWQKHTSSFENCEDLSTFLERHPAPNMDMVCKNDNNEENDIHSINSDHLHAQSEEFYEATENRLAPPIGMQYEEYFSRLMGMDENTFNEMFDDFLKICPEELHEYYCERRLQYIQRIEESKKRSSGFLATFKDWTNRFMIKVTEHPFITGISTVLCILSVVGVVGYFAHGDGNMEAEASVSGDERTRKKLTKMRIEASVSGDERTRKKVTRFASEGDEEEDLCLVDDMIAQGSTDPQMLSIINSVVYNNTAIIEVTNDDVPSTSVMNAFAICGTIFCAPLHAFIKTGTDEADVTLEMRGNVRITFKLSDCSKIKIVEDKDLIFFEVPRTVCDPMRDVRNHFSTLQDISKYSMSNGMLANLRRCSPSNRVLVLRTLNKVNKSGAISYHHEANGYETKLKIVDGYRYQADTENGSCGGPVLWNQSCVSKKILGFHMAGGAGFGAGCAVTRESLDKYLDGFSYISVEAPVLSAQCTGKGSYRSTDPLQYYGNVQPSEQYRTPEKSEIVKSALFGVFQPVTKPAMLRPENGIDPMRIGISKQFPESKNFPQDVVDECTDSYMGDILNLENSYYFDNARLLTDEEMINGVLGDEWIKPLNMKTSAGWPFNTSAGKRKKPGKFDFVIGNEEDGYVLTDMMKKKVVEREEAAKAGCAKFTLFCDTLKDERRPIDKVDSGKTRVFNIAPMDFNLLCRKYFGFFNAHVMNNHVYGEGSTGINVHSDAWGLLIKHLSETGSQYLAGDFSNYDKTLMWQLFYASLRIINRFYNDGDENAKVRECLFTSMFSAFHLCGQKVYRVHRGNPSGCVITVIINSLVNSLISRIAYILIGRQLNLTVDMASFRKDVRVKNYGDDNIGCVADAAAWYNMNTISEILAQYNITYTSADKKEISKPFVELKDITYLKREFVWRDGHCWAPLSLDSIHEMVNWIRKSPDLEESSRSNYEAALREMVHYGKRSYDNFQKRVIDFSFGKISLDVIPYDNSLKYIMESKAELIAQSGDEEDILINLEGPCDIDETRPSYSDAATTHRIYCCICDRRMRRRSHNYYIESDVVYYNLRRYDPACRACWYDLFQLFSVEPIVLEYLVPRIFRPLNQT